LGPRESLKGNTALARLISAFAVILVAHSADASPRGTFINGLVSIADGESFTVIRGDDLRQRPRDRAFFAAMDAHLALYPEWVPILHPKQSSEPR
jgi:hypothetical protein